MEETIRLKLQQVSGVAFLRLPERPFEEPHIGKTECRGARRESWFDCSFRSERVVSSRRGCKYLWKSGADGSSYGASAHTLKQFTPRQTMFLVGRIGFGSILIFHVILLGTAAISSVLKCSAGLRGMQR
jgi:hypothetical protein